VSRLLRFRSGGKMSSATATGVYANATIIATRQGYYLQARRDRLSHRSVTA
jgi:hypothetical protein